MTTLAPPKITKTPYTVPSPQEIIQPALEGKQDTMVLNMGPHHPSTHGVLRLVVELDGETVVSSTEACACCGLMGKRPCRLLAGAATSTSAIPLL